MDQLVSVIVPIYKVEAYLESCVDSILAQTYQTLEIILVNDGSPDRCGAICDEYAAKDSRVKVLHKPNGGLSDARNAGMAVAHGTFLMFVDSDDLLPPDAVEILLELACKENAELVIGGHDRFEEVPPVQMDNDQNSYRVLDAREAMAAMFRNGCAAWARIYRRGLHEGILFPVGEINEDEAIVLRLLDRCERVVQTDAVVYHYRCRPESITTVEFNVKKLAWKDHCAANLEFVREKYPKLIPDAAKRYRDSLLWSLTEMAMSDTDFSHEAMQLREELSASRKLFRQTNFRYRQDRIRMEVLLNLPYAFYKKVLRLKRGVR